MSSGPPTEKQVTGQMLLVATSVFLCSLLGLVLAVAGVTLVLQLLSRVHWLLVAEYIFFLLTLGFLVGLTELKLFSASLVFSSVRRAGRWLLSPRGLGAVSTALLTFLVLAGLAVPGREINAWRARYDAQIAARKAAEAEAQALRATLAEIASQNEQVRAQLEQLEDQKAILVSDNQALRTNLQKVLGTPTYGRP